MAVHDTQAQAERSGTQAVLGILLGFALPVAALAAFAAGHAAIDRPEPETERGRTWYLGAVLVAGLAVAAFFTLAPRSSRASHAWGLLAAGPAGFIALGYGTTYRDAGFTMVFIAPLLLAYALGFTLAVVILWARFGPVRAMPLALVGGAGLAGGIGVAAAWLAATIEQQAEAAREAYEAPGLQMLALVMVLVVLAARRRRLA